jgi:glucose/arabinose dehydrogenase
MPAPEKLIRQPRAGLWQSLRIGAIALGIVAAASATAAILPAGFTEAQVATGLANPTAMAFAPDGRLFVAEQGGTLRVIKNGALLATPFLAVTVSSSGERGLLGVAFDPDFATNNHVYVYYTATTPTIHNRVSRFTANGDTALAGSETVILELNTLSSATNHNGGAMHFGPDGKLYIAVGENANGANAQSFTNLLGKMLRINRDGTIPADNPFFLTAANDNRAIWALGLRNPFTFAFQPGSGRMFINDVGQSTWEEIDEGSPGANYGWPATEGQTGNPAYRSPVYWYGHGSGNSLGCAITGGTFYSPAVAQFPANYAGVYFFADYCGDWINVLDPANGNAVTGFATGIDAPVDLQVGPDGSLYYLARGAGAVVRIDYPANLVPVIARDPFNVTVAVGASASFDVVAFGAPTLAYQWQRNGVDITGATGSMYTLPSVAAADAGARFRCVVTNQFGSDTSAEATLKLTVNTPPAGTVTSPAAGTLYKAGDTITYAGTGTDAEDGNLPPSQFTWRVDFYHNDGALHFHPFIPATSGKTGGSFVIPTSGETSPNVFYRIWLTVTDSGGLTHTSFRDVLPRTATITLATNPPGLQLTLDGQPYAGPVVGVAGMTRSIGTPVQQTMGGKTYTFRSWSPRGSATHDITTPTTDKTYTATFKTRR